MPADSAIFKGEIVGLEPNYISGGDTPLLEFTSAEPMTMSFELFFDGYAPKERLTFNFSSISWRTREND